MKKKLLIDLDCIVKGQAEEPGNVAFHSYAISSLVRIGRDLGFAIVFSHETATNSLSNTIKNLLQSENLQIDQTDRDIHLHITKTPLADEASEKTIIFDPGHNDWRKILETLRSSSRLVTHQRNTKETQIAITLNLDGTGQGSISTGLHFFDHMLEQIARHGSLDLTIQAHGDLHIDEHHTIEDTAITLGETFALALGDKRGIERYGFCLPMDDALAQVAVDFGGRNWIEWQAEFKREKVGDMPTEMFFHFFKSFSDSARCNLNIQATGTNEHHKIEAIFKAFAKAIKTAVKRDLDNMQLPSTKGLL